MKEKPSLQAYLRLSQHLQDEEAIHGPRNVPTLLKERVDAGQAAYILLQDKIIAFNALWETDHPDWAEQGSLWVHPNHRGKGFAREVKQELYQLIRTDQSTFVITHHDGAVKLAKSFGMIEASVDTWDAAPWDATCGKCDRFETVKEKLECPLKAVPTECRLFFKKP